MASTDDVFPPDDLCEICGAQLDDEIVIQEFADGSLARLCNECAVGATLGTERHLGHDPIEPVPESQVVAETDPLERTRELLTPVVDLIGLQREMQGALERLAASLETFAAGVLTENLDKTATVEDRVQSLERELVTTRARLREAEALLSAASITPAGATPPTEEADLTSGGAPLVAADAETAPVVEAAPAAEEVPEAEPALSSEEASSQAMPIPVPIETPRPPVFAPEIVPPPGQPEEARYGFRIEEVQTAQRYFNESPFTGKTRDVQISLGKPRANLTRAAGSEPRAFVTVAWDIVWYQYLVDMRPDIPSDQRVVLHREGMNLDELAHQFKEQNAIVDNSGRVDASELEIKLLSDPTALITEMTPDEERALEDATEEVWDQHTAPEFKWDD